MSNFNQIMQDKFGTTSPKDLMDKLGVSFKNDLYWWQGKASKSYEETMLKAAAAIKDDDEPQLEFFFCTTPNIAGREIKSVLGLVSADCAYGMNLFRDMFASFRDLVGGRSAAVEKVLKDAKRTVQYEMSEQAKEMGADAIVSVDFDFNELDGGAKNGMLVVSGIGTAVLLEK